MVKHWIINAALFTASISCPPLLPAAMIYMVSNVARTLIHAFEGDPE